MPTLHQNVAFGNVFQDTAADRGEHLFATLPNIEPHFEGVRQALVNLTDGHVERELDAVYLNFLRGSQGRRFGLDGDRGLEAVDLFERAPVRDHGLV